MATTTNLGRVQGGGFFGSTSTSETNIPVASVTMSGVSPLAGDTIVNANGVLCRINEISGSNYAVTKYGTLRSSGIDPEAVRYVPQTLTAAQKLQARENIDAQIAGDYAVTDGTYPNMTVGKAVADGGNNNISATYMKKSDLLNKTYPIGAIYLSYASTSPASLFGGSWTRIEGRFLLGASSTYTAGSTGGEAAHTLTIDEMPAHSHPASLRISKGDNAGSPQSLAPSNTYWNDEGKYVNIEIAGSGQSHNNMPPYIAVYIWRRTA